MRSSLIACLIFAAALIAALSGCEGCAQFLPGQGEASYEVIGE